MTLGDVAVDLTQEEWGLVGPAPKTLYQDVMLETFGHLDIDLGDPARHHCPAGTGSRTTNDGQRTLPRFLPRMKEQT